VSRDALRSVVGDVDFDRVVASRSRDSGLGISTRALDVIAVSDHGDRA
jgi:hypothetical protein